MKEISRNLCFEGEQLQCQHQSTVLDCTMNFSIFLPPQARQQTVPVLYFLSGLTCTDQNFVTKAGAQRYAAQHGIAIVCPDTSPRGEDVPDDPEGAFDFGSGAGFYVNATEAPWDKHYQMYDYVVRELPELVNTHFPLDPARTGVTGHSMGGHGALTIALKNPQQFSSVSAFAPIVSPMNCPWGHKALGQYLGPDPSHWERYDTCALIRASRGQDPLPILVDQGDADDFQDDQLKTGLLVEAAEAVGYPLEVRMQRGYDHSYYFIASFIGEHIAFHARHLGA